MSVQKSAFLTLSRSCTLLYILLSFTFFAVIKKYSDMNFFSKRYMITSFLNVLLFLIGVIVMKVYFREASTGPSLMELHSFKLSMYISLG